MKIEELGAFAFIDRLTDGFKSNGDDAAVTDAPDGRYNLYSTDLLLEGIHFDLTYTPLRHLGYKCVVTGISDIAAMNGTPKQILIGLGISARFSVEMVEELYAGVRIACQEYNVELIGGDTVSSLTGLTLSVTAIGEVEKEKVVYRSGAKDHDLICITGDLGAAYLGTRLLEREKRVLKGNGVAKPQLEGYEYQLGRALRPECRTDIVKRLSEAKILPTAMIDLSDGLASDLMQICKSSGCGARIYLDRIPIASTSFELADELHLDYVTAALNGGEDYQLLFTVGVDKYEEIVRMGGVDVIGHITDAAKGVALTTPDGADIPLQAQGWTAVRNEETKNDSN